MKNRRISQRNVSPLLHPYVLRNRLWTLGAVRRPGRGRLLACLALMALLLLAATSGRSAHAAPPETYPELVRRGERRAAALAAEEFTRALDAVTAMYGPQDLRSFTAKEAAQRLVDNGFTDPYLPFSFDSAPLDLDGRQRFRPAANSALMPEDVPTVPLPRQLWEKALADPRYPVRWYALQCLARFPGQGEHARPALLALAREPLPALVRAYARALCAVPVQAPLAEINDFPGRNALVDRLWTSPGLEERCLALLLASTLPPSRAGFAAATQQGLRDAGLCADLLLAQLDRTYPVQTVEQEVRALGPEVLDRLAHGLRHAWAAPQDRLAALLARFPDHGPALEALAHALLNRNHADYEPSHRALIQIWEQLTGIAFQGTAEPFLQWYHAHKPMPAQP